MDSGIITKEGIPFNADGYVLFTSDKLDECIRVYKKYKCNKALFSRFGDSENSGYKLANLDLLDEIEVEDLIILASDLSDISALSTQKGLKALRIESAERLQGHLVDFSNFPKLEKFRGYWSRQLKNLFDCRSLKELTLWKYKPKENDLSELAGLSNLGSLEIFQSSIVDATGLEQLKKLRSLALAYNSKLTSFSKTTDGEYNLEELKIEACPKLDIQTLPVMPYLKIFEFLNNGKIETLEPALNKMKSLEEISFSETSLTNGDNTFLLKHPKLKSVYFLNKKYYKFTCDEVNEGLQDEAKKKALLSRKK
jgi:Leucine-rich repeat (LRR) protein